jgi:hypothetical protein
MAPVLPLPPLETTANPYTDFADYLQAITHLSLYGPRNLKVILTLIALLA